MASLKRLSTDAARASYWESQLTYYRKLLVAHGQGFWPAKFAETALNHMARNLTKAIGANLTEDVSDGADAFTSPGTSWSSASYDYFLHNLANLDDSDLYAAYAANDTFEWQPMSLPE